MSRNYTSAFSHRVKNNVFIYNVSIRSISKNFYISCMLEMLPSVILSTSGKLRYPVDLYLVREQNKLWNWLVDYILYQWLTNCKEYFPFYNRQTTEPPHSIINIIDIYILLCILTDPTNPLLW